MRKIRERYADRHFGDNVIPSDGAASGRTLEDAKYMQRRVSCWRVALSPSISDAWSQQTRLLIIAQESFGMAKSPVYFCTCESLLPHLSPCFQVYAEPFPIV